MYIALRKFSVTSLDNLLATTKDSQIKCLDTYPSLSIYQEHFRKLIELYFKSDDCMNNLFIYFSDC